MNRQEMIDKIYDVIADKTPSFGCTTSSGYKLVSNNSYYNPGGYIEGMDEYDDESVEPLYSLSYPEYDNLGNLLKDENGDNISIDEGIIGHPVRINTTDYYFKKNDRPDLCIDLETDYLLKPVEERPEFRIKELYDNLLILGCK